MQSLIFRISLLLLLVTFSSISLFAKKPTLEELIEWNKSYKERILDIVYDYIPIDYAEKLEKSNEYMFEFNFTWNREWIEKNSYIHEGSVIEEPVWNEEIAPLIKYSLLAEYDEETLNVLDVTCKQRVCIIWAYYSTNIIGDGKADFMKKFPYPIVYKIGKDISIKYNYDLAVVSGPGGNVAYLNDENYMLMNIQLGFSPSKSTN